MKIKIIAATVLKGKGLVKVGDILTEQDADPVELRRLVAYKKAIEATSQVQTQPTSQTPPAVQQQQKKSGLNTSNAGAIKG